jgi:DNA-binding beta-propeller fold protein YncE
VKALLSFFRFLSIVASAALAVSSASGYFAINQSWPDGSTIQMELEMGATNTTLQDGFRTWNDSAADALAAWNLQMATVQFSWIFDSTTGKASGDGNNSVFFSNSVFGDSFGEEAIAVTVYLIGNGISEGDVIVNQAFPFNSYRGPLQGNTYDIHRTFLHEFGHVIGLAHPDEYSQQVTAIMNSVIGNLDHLAQDDMDGAWSLYGVMRDVQTPLFAIVGTPFSYQVTTNIPATSFSATSLPEGMTIDSTTGLVTGIAGLSGTYVAQITFNGHPLDIYDNSLTIYVSAAPPEDFRATFPFTVNRLLADSFRPRVYASLPYPSSVVVIDTTNLSILKEVPVASEPRGMALSPDGKKLFVTETGYNRETGDVTDPVIGVIDADSLSALPSLSAPTALNDVAAGLDNRLFVASYSNYLPSDLFEMDAITGAVLPSFPTVTVAGDLALSPDLRTLHSDGTYFFDVSSPSPILIQYDSTYLFSLLSHNGEALCTSNNQNPSTVKIVPADDLTQPGVSLSPPAGATPTSIAAFSSDDTTLFTFTHSTTTTDYVDVYDAVAGKHLRSLAGRCTDVIDMVVDASGQFLFTASSDILGLLQVYETGLGTSFHPANAKRLLNVSTRLATAPGEDTLIGGFIISGKDSKQVAVRALGPSLPVTGKLGNPVVDLYNSFGELVESNDDWNLNRAAVLAI